MNRVHALTVLSILLAPAIAQACPMAMAADCGASGGSFWTYAVGFGGGLIVGVGSIIFGRRG